MKEIIHYANKIYSLNLDVSIDHYKIFCILRTRYFIYCCKEIDTTKIEKKEYKLKIVTKF